MRFYVHYQKAQIVSLILKNQYVNVDQSILDAVFVFTAASTPTSLHIQHLLMLVGANRIRLAAELPA